MLENVLRVVRFAAVLTILVAVSGYQLVRPAMADDKEEDAARCQAAEGTWCAGAGFNPEAECTGSNPPCTTCVNVAGTCSGHSGYRED